MQVYGSLVLEDNSEVGKAVLGRRSISCVCTSAFLLPTKEADPQLAMGPSVREFGDFPYLWSWGLPVRFPEGPIVKGTELVLGYLFMVSQPNLSSLEQIWLHDGQWCVTSHICLHGRENRTFLKDLSPWPSWFCPFPWTQSQRATVKHTYGLQLNKKFFGCLQNHCGTGVMPMPGVLFLIKGNSKKISLYQGVDCCC